MTGILLWRDTTDVPEFGVELLFLNRESVEEKKSLGNKCREDTLGTLVN